ncbi:protodermal factor 2 [Hibiscus trionum]|uniref:Protodermal factor 2 n=1 Tax=Hibiscus trionum TaxID=183268 RepID=A0A9W7J4C6_HIBTR|nr:protodermal factor 2 [Hibiscus trionum]
MDNMGGNGANRSGNSQQDNNNVEEQFNNGGFGSIQNIVEPLQENPTGGFQAALGDGFRAAGNPLGFNQPPQLTPQENYILHGNGNFSFPPMFYSLPMQNPFGSVPWMNVPPNNMSRVSDLLMAVSIVTDPNRNKTIEKATKAMEELVKLATTGEPLWQRDDGIETLNEVQYMMEFSSLEATIQDIIRMVEVGQPQLFPSFDSFDLNAPTPPSVTPEPEHLHMEASRHTAYINMNPMNIVGLLMDPNQWSMAFSHMVSKTSLLGIVLNSVDGSYNGVLQVMSAEFHQSTPLVSTRQCYFARYCKMLAYGTWGVVDVSLENLFPDTEHQFRRRPSGCLIQDMPQHGCSKVTWVEHVEADHASIHPIFNFIVTSGYAFGAQRWMAGIKRHSQWLSASMARTAPTDAGGVLILQPGRESLLKLAQRMTRNFFMNISSCTENLWMQLPPNFFGYDDVRFRIGDMLAVPGRAPTNTLVFTTSARFPVPVKTLFDFFQHVPDRFKWDLLLSGRLVRELACVRTGENPENRISILQMSPSPNRSNAMQLQENYYDETGAYIVYAPIDTQTMSFILNGGNPNCPPVLPSGFAILPAMPPGLGDEHVGSILTVVFQIDTLSTDQFVPDSTVAIMDEVLDATVAMISDAILDDGEF